MKTLSHRESWKKRARRDHCEIRRLSNNLRILPSHQTTSNHTMSAVNSQSLSTGLTVVSANIEGITAHGHRDLPHKEDTGCTRLDCCRHLHKFRFLGKLAVALCRLAGSAPHKSGGHRVKSWPDVTHKQTHSSHLDLWPLSQTNKQETNLNQM